MLTAFLCKKGSNIGCHTLLNRRKNHVILPIHWPTSTNCPAEQCYRWSLLSPAPFLFIIPLRSHRWPLPSRCPEWDEVFPIMNFCRNEIIEFVPSNWDIGELRYRIHVYDNLFTVGNKCLRQLSFLLFALFSLREKGRTFDWILGCHFGTGNTVFGLFLTMPDHSSTSWVFFRLFWFRTISDSFQQIE